MNVPTKLGAYLVGVLAVFGAAAGIGTAVGPLGASVPAHNATHEESTMNHDPHSPAAGGHLPGGLQVSQDGYTLDVARILPAGLGTPVSFRILGPNGEPVNAYDTNHDKDLHLVAVRHDLTGYQHVHPTGTPKAPGRCHST